MATTKKKTTTTKTTSASKTKTAAKATVKKSAPVKKTTTSGAKAATKKTPIHKNVTEFDQTKIRITIIVMGVLLALAYYLPVGEILGETQNGRSIMDLIFKGEFDGILGYVLAIIAPLGLSEIAAILLVVRSDKFMAIMSVMINVISVTIMGAFAGSLGQLEIGWYVMFCIIVVELVYSIGLFVSFPSKRR